MARCYVADCDRPIYGNGLCNRHWQRARRLGSPYAGKTYRKRPTHCTVPGCGRPCYALRVCSAHYARLRKNGDVQADKPIARRRGRKAKSH